MNKRLCQIIKKCDCVIIPDYGCDTENFRYVGPIVIKFWNVEKRYVKDLILPKKQLL